MSTFDTTGIVKNIQKLTSKQGKPYATFQLITDDGDTIEFSLFGDSMSFFKYLVPDKALNLKGKLKSREYNGKFYPDLKIQWIEIPKPSAMTGRPVADVKRDPQTDEMMDSIPF